MKRIEPLDGLRGVSIALVVLSHAGLGHVVPGGLGVTLFFFISGYIISRLLLKELQVHGRIDVPAFFGRRAFRILPALLAYLAVATACVWHLSAQVDLRHLLAAVFNVYNYYYLYALDHANPVNHHHPYAIVWSLAVEEHFYLIYPFVAAALLSKPQRALRWLLTLCALSLVWRCWLVFGIGLEQMPHERIYKATDTRLDSIAWGVVFAVVQDRMTVWPADRLQRWGSLGLWSGLLLLLATLLVRDEGFRQSWRYSLQGLAIGLMAWRLLCSDHLFSRALACRPLVWLGRISYSLYLWHWLVNYLLEQLPGLQAQGPFVAPVLLVVCSLLIAELSHRWIEQPALRRGRDWLSRRT